MQREDATEILSTSSGKSPSWTLPLLARKEGVSLVITPFTSLGLDSELSNKCDGVSSLFIYSEKNTQQDFEQAATGDMLVIYVCPEMLEGPSFDSAMGSHIWDVMRVWIELPPRIHAPSHPRHPMHPIPPAAPACAPAILAQRKRAPPRRFAGPAQWTVHALTHAHCIPPQCPTRISCAIPATLFRTSHPPTVITRHRPARHPVIFCCKPFVSPPGPHHAGMTVCACLLVPSCSAHHRRSTTQPSPPFPLLAVHLSLSYSDPGSFSFSFESPFSNFWPSPRSLGIKTQSLRSVASRNAHILSESSSNHS
ncbi:hypothetical protein C8J57DRAFT_1645476 [Mycena rebaudengoi]|nr:hypothetical protein C8J57DRAFT_1645476 [Mycena rebaudengoi]